MFAFAFLVWRSRRLYGIDLEKVWESSSELPETIVRCIEFCESNITSSCQIFLTTKHVDITGLEELLDQTPPSVTPPIGRAATAHISVDAGMVMVCSFSQHFPSLSSSLLPFFDSLLSFLLLRLGLDQKVSVRAT